MMMWIWNCVHIKFQWIFVLRINAEFYDEKGKEF